MQVQHLNQAAFAPLLEHQSAYVGAPALDRIGPTIPKDRARTRRVRRARRRRHCGESLRLSRKGIPAARAEGSPPSDVGRAINRSSACFGAR